MGDWRRHAIYFAPPKASELARFGAAWLGRDAERGMALPPPASAMGLPWEGIVAEPRRYGFHATLKAPFRLAGGRSEAELDAATAAVAGAGAPFALRLKLVELGGFLALVPEAMTEQLAALERACVTGLDAFRAPADAAEMARRRGVGLGAAEEENLRRWGYPWVLGRFRFHMTLTGALTPDLQTRVRAVLEPALAPILSAPVPVAEVCRFGEAEDGAFALVKRFPLGDGRVTVP